MAAHAWRWFWQGLPARRRCCSTAASRSRSRRLAESSTVVADRNGVPLRIFTTPSGLWRLTADPDTVSPPYLRLLVDIEDKRFDTHPGVDPLALGRAVLQRLERGHVVSGASTLTMQVVRLLEPRPRTLRSKLIEIARALQLEAHWSKRQILARLSHADPDGAQHRGRAGRQPRLVRQGTRASLRRRSGPAGGPPPRPDATAARPHRNDGRSRPRSRAAPRRGGRHALGGRAGQRSRGADADLASPDAHAGAPPRRASRAPGTRGRPIGTTLDGTLQQGAERVLAQALHELPRPVTLAAVVADWHSGAVLARIGSADYHDARRAGAIDMTRAVRSPGSTLKPFIYGMAFDGLLAHPGSLVRDAATRFDDYAPHNFDGTFTGDVTVRQALQASLNLPAVLTLRRLGPVVFTERFKAAGLDLELGASDMAPGLPIALGGVGTTLETLVTAYAALANGGAVTPLTETGGAATPVPDALFAPGAADAVADILAGMPPPKGVGGAGRIAFKTGTSFRFRDGWAVGFDGARVIGVWMGRADGGTCACVGASAATILFRLFDLLPPAPLPPRVLTPVFAAAPPPALVRLDAVERPRDEDGPHITFPIPRSRLLVGRDGRGGHQAGGDGRRQTLSLDGRRQAGREPPLRPRNGVAARRHRLFDRLGRRRARPRRSGCSPDRRGRTVEHDAEQSARVSGRHHALVSKAITFTSTARFELSTS